MTTISSEHRDGRIMSKAMGTLGIGSVAGSSTRGGVNGFRNLLKVINQGSHVSITPDGPKGPVGVVKPGVLLLAALSRKKILPISTACSREWRFRSWDKMMLPKPFAKVVVVFGEPMDVPREFGDEEQIEMIERLESSLHQLARDAEQCLASDKI